MWSAIGSRFSLAWACFNTTTKSPEWFTTWAGSACWGVLRDWVTGGGSQRVRCPSLGLSNPVCHKDIGLVRDFAVASRHPNQFLSVGAEHGEAIEAVGERNPLEILAVQ